MTQRSKKRWTSAAARRLCSLAHDAPSVESAVQTLVDELLLGVSCPPTDLDAIMARLNVKTHEGRDGLFGSGALLREGDGLKIVYSSQLSYGRKRWTIAHELGHAIFEKTGRSPPRHGRELERLCDMIATELLLPRKYFGPLAEERTCLDGVLRLARVFQTSLSATAIRFAEMSGVSVFETQSGKLRWGYGEVRSKFDLASEESLVRVVSSSPNCDCGSDEMHLTFRNRTRRWIVEWQRIGSADRRLFMLRLPDSLC